jgi:hypothetical protein
MDPQQTGPIFIIGRQHSGNTMLATVLERSPEVFCLKGEGAFFEHWKRADQLAPQQRAHRVSELIRRSGLSQHAAEELRAVLLDEVQEPSSSYPSAQALYRRGMAYLAAQNESARWAQKATSYVFHVDAILSVFPNARLVFLARNPLDLAASIKRRIASGARLLRIAWGWNRGVRLAREHQRAHPERFLLVRYEDLARQPRDMLTRIFDFAGLTFDPAYLQVDHVNRSETPYNDTSRQRGINTSRVFYYDEELSPTEEQCVRFLANRSLLEALYADLPPPRAPSVLRSLPVMAKLLASGGTHLAKDHLQQLRAHPRHTAQRVWERLT